MKIKSQLIVLLSSLLFAIGGLAFGASVNVVANDRVIYACVTGVNGNITKVSNVAHNCPRGSTPISWNEQGIQGNQGIKGDKGDQGDQGEAGAITVENMGLVPWYLADGEGTPKLAPVDFTVVPTADGNGLTDVMIDNKVVGVRLFDGGITNPSTAKYGPLFYSTSDCSGNEAYLESSKVGYFYEDLETSTNWVGVANSDSWLFEAASTSNAWFLINDFRDYLNVDLGLNVWGSPASLNFNQLSSHCWSFNTSNLYDYLVAVYNFTYPLPANPTWQEIEAHNMKLGPYFWTYLKNHKLQRMAPTTKPADVGPLQVVSNY